MTNTYNNKRIHDSKVHKEYEELLNSEPNKFGQRENRVFGSIPDEYSFRKGNVSGKHFPEEESNARHTLLSRKQQNTLMTVVSGKDGMDLENQFSQIKPKIAESELKENSFIKDLEDSNTLLKQKLLKLGDQNENLEDDIKNLKKQLEDLKKKLNEAEGNNEDLNSELERLKKWKKKYSDLENQLNEVEDELDNLKRQKNKTDRENKNLNGKLEELEKERESDKQKINELNGKLKGYEQNLDGSNNELKKMLADLKNKNGKESDYNDILQEIMRKVDNISKSNFTKIKIQKIYQVKINLKSI